MQFFSNKIPVGNKSNFGDLIQKIANSNEATIKTASVEDLVVAECDDADEDCVRTDKHSGEASPKDQNGEAEADGESKTVDPDGLSAGSDSDTKVASEGTATPSGAGDGEDLDGVNTGRFPDDFDPQQEAEDEGTADVEASTETQIKEAGELPQALKDHQFKAKGDSDDSDSDSDDKDCDSDDSDSDDDGESCEANSGSKLEKIANLSPKAKSRLKAYWKMVYPEAYSDAMTQEK